MVIPATSSVNAPAGRLEKLLRQELTVLMAFRLELVTVSFSVAVTVTHSAMISFWVKGWAKARSSCSWNFSFFAASVWASVSKRSS
jgi:hypothetical protein